MLESAVQQQQNYLFCYQWLHEDLLSQTGVAVIVHQPTRKQILTNLHRVSQLEHHLSNVCNPIWLSTLTAGPL